MTAIYKFVALFFAALFSGVGVFAMTLQPSNTGTTTNFAISRRGVMVAASLTTLLSASLPTHADNLVTPCQKAANGGPPNCVSTSSVRQVDLYAAPWTWPEDISTEEVMARLKGSIASDASLAIVEQEDLILKVKADRKFATDELVFIINPIDRVVTFQSQQLEGPDSVSDFGTNRKRLEDIRKRVQVLSVMGADIESADSGPREGVSAQLKAFWGFQSGGGYESVLLDED